MQDEKIQLQFYNKMLSLADLLDDDIEELALAGYGDRNPLDPNLNLFSMSPSSVLAEIERQQSTMDTEVGHFNSGLESVGDADSCWWPGISTGFSNDCKNAADPSQADDISNGPLFDDECLEDLSAILSGYRELQTEIHNQFDHSSMDEANSITAEKFDQLHTGELRMMTVKTQPAPYHHPRYESDGKRRTKNSRTNPMGLNLPPMTRHLLTANVPCWIEISLATSENNPKGIKLAHANQLQYHDASVRQINSTTVRVPLTNEDIQKGYKMLPHLSITRTKRDLYDYEIKSVHSLPNDGPVEKYTVANEDRLTAAAKAKLFVSDYDLLACCLVCNLILEYCDNWHRTDVTCCTNLIYEQNYKNKTKKRPIEADDATQLPCVSNLPPKRERRGSSTPFYGLPVTRIKKHDEQ